VNEATQPAIHPVPDASKLRQLSLNDGLRPLRLAGMMKVAEGVTTMDEVLRSTPSWDT
jgi:general secretion pathway protein E